MIQYNDMSDIINMFLLFQNDDKIMYDACVQNHIILS